MRSCLALLLSTLLLLAACAPDQPPPPPKPKQGRAETQSIRNLDAVGYGGSAIANKIDDALNKNDQSVKRAEQKSQEPPASEPAAEPPQ